MANLISSVFLPLSAPSGIDLKQIPDVVLEVFLKGGRGSDSTSVIGDLMWEALETLVRHVGSSCSVGS